MRGPAAIDHRRPHHYEKISFLYMQTHSDIPGGGLSRHRMHE